MFGSFLSQPTVSVTVEQEMVFVRPNTFGIASEDPEIRGTVLLSLPSKRAIKSIRVELTGLCDAYGGAGWKYESSTTLQKHLDLELGDEVLAAGNHAFNFSFIVPSSTAVYQRSIFGRVRHYVKATVECSSGIMSTFSSNPVAIWISAHENPANEPPAPLELCIEHFSEDLGIIGIGVSSPHLTVASLLSLRVTLLGVPANLTIRSITCSIIQDPEPLVNLTPGLEWKYQRLMRVPDDDHVRPSTLEGTDTRIRASHRLSIEIRYRRECDADDKATTITKPIIIASCCSTIDSLFLPAYDRTAPKTIIRPLEMRLVESFRTGESDAQKRH
ncbi:hypothetical protein RQP46_010816 [Phenoliferia psychrophenolica]